MHKNSDGYCGPMNIESPVRAYEPHWLAMMKLAASDWSMAANDVACLLERNVVAKTGRVLGLESDDRVVLGLTV